MQTVSHHDRAGDSSDGWVGDGFTPIPIDSFDREVEAAGWARLGAMAVPAGGSPPAAAVAISGAAGPDSASAESGDAAWELSSPEGVSL